MTSDILEKIEQLEAARDEAYEAADAAREEEDWDTATAQNALARDYESKANRMRWFLR